MPKKTLMMKAMKNARITQQSPHYHGSSRLFLFGILGLGWLMSEDNQINEIVLKQTTEQLKWIDSMVERYKAATNRKITRQDVVMQVLFHGYAGAENEMAAIEQGLWPIKGRKIKHLTILD